MTPLTLTITDPTERLLVEHANQQFSLSQSVLYVLFVMHPLHQVEPGPHFPIKHKVKAWPLSP